MITLHISSIVNHAVSINHTTNTHSNNSATSNNTTKRNASTNSCYVSVSLSDGWVDILKQYKHIVNITSSLVLSTLIVL